MMGIASSTDHALNHCGSSESSDYGSELDTDDEAALATLIAHLAESPPKNAIQQATVAGDAGLYRAVDEFPNALQVPQPRSPVADIQSIRGPGPVVEVELEQKSFPQESTTYVAENPEPVVEDSLVPVVAQEQLNDPAIRSPLQRFRTKPSKPLSVTDLVSPAWCELQYWYALTKFGRKLRTAAMKQGSAVHRELEKQVHDFVEVQVKSKEDAFGLRIWNVIQGLRSLRITGMTRELEIWGIIDGQVVNGIIDELSDICPDSEFEQSMQNTNASNGKEDFGAFSKIIGDNDPTAIHSNKKVYITDVKTRGVASVPTGVGLRPTYMQLMLYRRLLGSLAGNNVDAEAVFSRYSLRSLEPFSTDFIDEISAMEYNFRETTPLEGTPLFSDPSTSMGELASHNNLSSLWSLMIMEFRRALPTTSISNVLHVEFRLAATGAVIGNKVFAYDDTALDKYTSSVMSWWKGHRQARGVDIEEAFKCRFCDFAENCTWRKEKIDEATEKYRLKAAGRNKSTV